MSRDPVLDPSGLARAAERLASLVPGYNGYKSRERLREEDRAVREAVTRQLGIIMGRLERALQTCIRSLASPDVEAADKLLRSLGRDRDRIRFAPAGYSSLFSRKKIQDQELQNLVALDAGLWSVLEELDRIAGAWDEDSRDGGTEWPSNQLRDVVIELEEVLDERESYLRS
jgi:hypothetical protein